MLHDHYVVQKMQHFNRERVPERVVHAKGGGAHGFFEVTDDVTQFTKAAFLSRSASAPRCSRASPPSPASRASPDTVRDPRGFALKFYTEDGNYDMVGNNTPVVLRPRPARSSRTSSTRRSGLPDTGLRSNDMQWDFWTLSPESAHQVTILMSDRGIPRTWRHMNGFSSHTYSWMNAGGERFWVKYHFKTVQGIENLTGDEADAHGRRGRRLPPPRPAGRRSPRGDAPEWRFEVQVMPFADAADYRFNPFDLTKVWPQGDYPLIEVGRMVLDRNPENFFAEVEQAGFDPSNLVPGHRAVARTGCCMGRIFSYHDTHLHRIGPTTSSCRSTRPQAPVHSYNKDGQMTYHHAGAQPVYAPNSYGGPAADPTARRRDRLGRSTAAELGRYRVRQARRGRRLRPARHARTRRDGRRRPRAPGRQHRRPPEGRRDAPVLERAVSNSALASTRCSATGLPPGWRALEPGRRGFRRGLSRNTPVGVVG